MDSKSGMKAVDLDHYVARASAHAGDSTIEERRARWDAFRAKNLEQWAEWTVACREFQSMVGQPGPNREADKLEARIQRLERM